MELPKPAPRRCWLGHVGRQEAAQWNPIGGRTRDHSHPSESDGGGPTAGPNGSLRIAGTGAPSDLLWTHEMALQLLAEPRSSASQRAAEQPLGCGSGHRRRVVAVVFVVVVQFAGSASEDVAALPLTEVLRRKSKIDRTLVISGLAVVHCGADALWFQGQAVLLFDYFVGVVAVVAALGGSYWSLFTVCCSRRIEGIRLCDARGEARRRHR